MGISLLDTDNGYHAINNGTLTGNSVHDSTYNELTKRRLVDLLTSFQESDLTQEQKNRTGSIDYLSSTGRL